MRAIVTSLGVGWRQGGTKGTALVGSVMWGRQQGEGKEVSTMAKMERCGCDCEDGKRSLKVVGVDRINAINLAMLCWETAC